MRILLPTDFSKSTTRALKFLAAIGKGRNFSVHLMHVLPPNIEEEISFSRKDWLNDLVSVSGFHADYKDLLDKTIREHSLITEVICVTGNMEKQILKYSNCGDYDMLFSCTHGTSGLMDFVMGTTTQNLVHDCMVPVVSLLEGHRISEKKKLLFVNDFEHAEEVDIKPIIDVVKTFGLELHMLKIVSQSIDHDKVELTHIHNFAKKHGIKNYVPYLHQSRSIDEGLVEFLDQVDVSMVAVATHGRHGISHFLLGSVAEDLTDRINVPVMTFRLHS